VRRSILAIVLCVAAWATSPASWMSSRLPSPIWPKAAPRLRLTRQRRRRWHRFQERRRAGGSTLAEPEALPSERVRFAHNSERQLATLLDFYGVAWEYEPTEFVLEWDAKGAPAQAFRPDFYLPAYDLYIEITTLNQKLVTKKNRKVRRLRELHPEVKIKIFYQRDYLALLEKYGLEGNDEETTKRARGER